MSKLCLKGKAKNSKSWDNSKSRKIPYVLWSHAHVIMSEQSLYFKHCSRLSFMLELVISNFIILKTFLSLVATLVPCVINV